MELDMNASSSLWQGTDRVKFFCQHLVALCLTIRRAPSDAPEAPSFKAYAGTLIRIRDAYCFLTAGHILREVEHPLRSDQVAIEHAVLADTFGRGRHTHPIPFDLKSAPIFYIDDDEDGLDFGVVFLAPYYVRLLSRNAIVALEEKNWVHQPGVIFDGHAMLGLPEEFTSPVVSSGGNGAVLPTMFAVQSLAVPPHDSRPTLYPRFVGAINPDLSLKSLKGMSGGPIFGFNFDGELERYWVVAMQSSWNRSQGLVYGCPVPLLASLMTRWSDEAVAALR